MRLVVSTVILLNASLSAQLIPSSMPNVNLESRGTLSSFSSLPLSFTQNSGQWDGKALFRAEAGGAAFFFCQNEIVYVFTREMDELIDDGISRSPDIPGIPDKFDRPRYKKESLVITARLLGANPDAEIVGEDRLSHNNNYFIGNDPSKWATDVPNYSSVTYKDIWPGVDLQYHGNDQGMKYDFIVNPGADISQIRIRYEGAENLSVTNQGDLEAQTRFGPVYERIPQIYQEIDGQKREISGHYALRESGVFGFALENSYNPAYPLVIDPELVYSTYLGGNDDDWGYGIAVDVSGSAYVTGTTYSTDFPTLNPYQTDQDDNDTFVTKLSPGGNSIVYSTYLGGYGWDCGNDIAVDGSGSAYVTGTTYSTDFPTLNPYQTDQPYEDVFVTKLSPGGNSLVYSTYLGGSYSDGGHGIAVDSSGSAYVTGYTASTDFPTVNPYDGSYNGGYEDVFVAKFSQAGNSLVYNTYLGGDDGDWGCGIAVDGIGSAYVTGWTYSTDFPTLYSFQTDQAYVDVFVTKLSPGGNSIVYSTYLGGNSDDWGYGIAVDGSGNAYVTGSTYSTDFPTLNPYQTDQADYDVFVTKFSPGGNSLVYNTYLGGNDGDRGYGIAVDGNGSAYVTGVTLSTDFPTINPYQAYQAYDDVFVARFAGGAPPVAISPNDTTILVCSLSEICLHGFSASDPDNNLDTVYAQGGTLAGDSVCFNPIVGINTLRLIAVDTDGFSDTSVTLVTVNLNHIPDAQSPSDTIIYGGHYSPICLHGFGVNDQDGNLDTAYAIEGLWVGDSLCFIPSERENLLRLVAIDSCGMTDTATTMVIFISISCGYHPGDINGSGQANGIDVTYGVSYLKGGNAPHPCSCWCPPWPWPFYASMDVNGNCAANGIDITYFVNYLKGQQPSLLYCDDCPPPGRGPAVTRQIEGKEAPDKVISEPIKDEKPIAPIQRPVLKPRGQTEASD